ncbi:MAG: diadenylate cyclase CdaA [Candidatus Omnitrophota bacterium]
MSVTITLKAVIEILILWFLIYHVLLFFENTRAIQVLRGIIVLLVVFFLFQKLHLEVLDWLFAKIFTISILAFLIIFHPEIRQGLARLGQRYIIGLNLKEEELDEILKQISQASDSLCRNKIGALIAIDKGDSLTPYVKSGVGIDAAANSDLIQTIFTPNSLLHDGGMIIQHGRIKAAGCLFPLTQKLDLSRIFGTRHRAALGLSEETDAVIVVISEERQDICLVHKGRFYRDMGKDELLHKMKDLLTVNND